MEGHREKLLVFNCHEAWVHQLGLLDYDLDIICDLPGHHATGWDTHVRPLPRHARIVSLEEAVTSPGPYTCIIAHNPTDLLDVRDRPEPRILVLHVQLQHRMDEGGSRLDSDQVRRTLHQYTQLTGVHVVAVSRFKGASWGFAEDIVPFAVDPNDYPLCTGEIACGLRICNFIQRRRKVLHWAFHEQAFRGLPVRVVGHNPGVPDTAPSRDWDHLKELLRTHRFYIHTAHPDLEDGYNMATTEAMAAGLPILGNRHPTSIVEHGVNGFVSNDPDELRRYARTLLEDRDLALKMGQQARLTAQERFSPQAFRSGMERAIESACLKRQFAQAPLPDRPAGRPVPQRIRVVEVPRRPGGTSSRTPTGSDDVPAAEGR